MNLEMPNSTTTAHGAVPGVTCTSDVGENKKEPEQSAARAAIQSVYGMPFFILYLEVMHDSIPSTNKGCNANDIKSKMVLLKTITSKYSCPVVASSKGGNSFISSAPPSIEQ